MFLMRKGCTIHIRCVAELEGVLYLYRVPIEEFTLTLFEFDHIQPTPNKSMYLIAITWQALRTFRYQIRLEMGVERQLSKMKFLP